MAWTIELKSGKKDVYALYEVTLMGEDICIGTRAGEDPKHGFQYGTLFNGSHEGFQSNLEEDSEEYKDCIKSLRIIHEEFLKVGRIINKDLYVDKDTLA
jgi:hypothetical protein